ncbi:MAG: glycerophosphodiester phosphodiesterase [Burkholderiaceae bacterium]|nr:glycerophosphodiester phosphodiesterase [Burkholderiaceae bacterium]
MSHFRPWPYPRVLAHRGGGTLAPENTIAAIDVGRSFGFGGIEIDATLARDEVPVLMHDPTVERTTDGTGSVGALTADELGRLDAGGWFEPRYRGEPVPTLAAAIRHCRAHDVWMDIEVKPGHGDARRTGEVVARTAAALYADCVRPGGDRADAIDPRAPLLSSFSVDALAAARAAVPDLPRGWITSRVPQDWRARLDALACVALHTNHRHLARDVARAIKDAGYWLFCYTVDDPARAREILDWGVDAFCTDRIDLIGPHFV